MIDVESGRIDWKGKVLRLRGETDRKSNRLQQTANDILSKHNRLSAAEAFGGKGAFQSQVNLIGHVNQARDRRRQLPFWVVVDVGKLPIRAVTDHDDGVAVVVKSSGKNICF